MNYYKCQKCKKSFNEFEMNYKKAQMDKRILCFDCRGNNNETKV